MDSTLWHSDIYTFSLYGGLQSFIIIHGLCLSTSRINVPTLFPVLQRQCLGPVVNNLSVVQKQYSNLAYALDTTRHQLPTADIYLPENEDHFQGNSHILFLTLVMLNICNVFILLWIWTSWLPYVEMSG